MIVWQRSDRVDETMFEIGTDGPSLILVAIDGSETSLRAGAYAGGLARRQGSRMVCLYVAQIPGTVASVPAAAGALMQMHESVARDLQETIAARAPVLGVEVTFVERSGDPYAEIVRLADELRVDAVVVGASMQAGHRLIGSLALRLVRDARWPVTVVP
jgi:nucleotide-binding universal stress UspA family protein